MPHAQRARDRYHVGLNEAGQATEPPRGCFEHWIDAAGAVITLMQEYADEDDQTALDDASPETTGYATEAEWLASDDYPTMRAAVDGLLTDDPPVLDEDFIVLLETHQLRTMSFWLLKTLCGDRAHLSTTSWTE